MPPMVADGSGHHLFEEKEVLMSAQTITMTPELESALTVFRDIWTVGDMPRAVAGRLQCLEVVTLARVLIALGERAAAANWLQDHTEDEQCNGHPLDSLVTYEETPPEQERCS